jgi:type I restriction enzyme S subunit
MGVNQTKISCIPNGWKIKNIQSLSKVAVSNGLYKSQEFYGNGPFMIHMTEVFANNVITDQQMPRVELSDKESAKYLLEDGDLVFARRSLKPEGAGDVSIVYPSSGMSFESSIIRVRLNQEAHPEFVYSYLKSSFGKAQMMTLVRHVAVSGITGDDLKKYQIPLPPKPEQKKIAQILSSWDKAIEKLEALIAAKQKRKKALMQQLLTGKKRFSGFEGEWSYLKANELFKTISQKNNGGADELLAVTQDQGVLPRNLLERRVVMPDGSTEGYKLVVPGNFIISLRSFQGGLEYSNYRGLVSPAYTVLKPIIKISDDFYRHYFKSYDFIGHLAVAVIGIRDGKQISYEDFSFLKLPYPPIEEQYKISSVLTAADTEIETHQKQLSALKEQKKGLMQQLLTGKKRVKVDQPCLNASTN